MPKSKKDGKYLNIYMDRKLFNTVERYYEETGIPKTRIVEDAVREYMQKRKIEIIDIKE